MIHIIDLEFHFSETIASFVVETSVGPVLVETGPHSTFDQLKAGLKSLGYKPSDIGYVFLTHIHFDHAGAAWAMAREGATIYVHPRGWKHLQNPERLYNSAKRIYGDMMEKLWGEMHSIPEDQLLAIEDQQDIQLGDTTFTAWHTPGHASHHIAWQCGSDLFTGDVAGCKILDGPVVPPCPPPDINLELWKESIDRVRTISPACMYLTHFGPVTDIEGHLSQLENILQAWGDWIKPYWEAGKNPQEVTSAFQKYADAQLLEAGLDSKAVQKYNAANPAWMSVAGLMRYWQKKSEGAF